MDRDLWPVPKVHESHVLPHIEAMTRTIENHMQLILQLVNRINRLENELLDLKEERHKKENT